MKRLKVLLRCTVPAGTHVSGVLRTSFVQHHTAPMVGTLIEIPTLDGDSAVYRIDDVEEAHFGLGSISTSSGVQAALKGVNLSQYLCRHMTADWGSVSDQEAVYNDAALKFGERIVSKFDHDGIPFLIVTEADRSKTQFLTIEEY